MNEQEEVFEYRTSDIYFSAYLQAIGIPMVRTETEKNDSGRPKKVFIFGTNSKAETEKMKTDFFSRRGKVVAAEYANALRSLKSLCHT